MFPSLRITDEKSQCKIARDDVTQWLAAGQNRQNYSVHLIICPLRIPGITRDQFCHSRLRQRLFKSASRAGILCQPVEQSADGFLHAGDNCQCRAWVWAKDKASLTIEFCGAL